MSEDQETQAEPGEKFGYLRRRYEPNWNEAGKRLDKEGLKRGTKEFRKARKTAARMALEKEYEGEIDVLTGLQNRRGFDRRIKEEAERVKRRGFKTSIVFIDVNDLKAVNDTEGHGAGDRLLVKLSRILEEHCRATDAVARLGGDEFALILPETKISLVQGIWERISSSFDEEGIKVAAGAVELNPRDVDYSIKKADETMYEAKAESKRLGTSLLKVHYE